MKHKIKVMLSDTNFGSTVDVMVKSPLGNIIAYRSIPTWPACLINWRIKRAKARFERIFNIIDANNVDKE